MLILPKHMYSFIEGLYSEGLFNPLEEAFLLANDIDKNLRLSTAVP